MSKLWHVDILSLYQSHNLCRFVETGTGFGDSLAFASQLPFLSLWSCEIERSLLLRARERVKDDPRVELFIGSSVQMLSMLPRLPSDEPILYWLDAHFPGADYGLHGYGDETNSDLRLPLSEELRLISTIRPPIDVIIIDDARIWLDDEPFENGPVPDELRAVCCPTERGIGFIEARFAATHQIAILHQQEGQIVLTPR